LLQQSGLNTDTEETRESTMINRAARSFLRRLATGSLIASVCAIGFGSSVQAQSLGPLVRVTDADPFTRCAADNVADQESDFGSILYPNTVIEPWIAVDPTHPSRLLVGHHQDRWSDGGARGLVGVLSKDGGAHWFDTIPFEVTRCTGGKRVRASDPWVVFANDGTALFESLVLDPAKPTTPFGARNSAVLVSRSIDHGISWQDPKVLIASPGLDVLNDKDSLTADPTENGLVYAVWDQLRILTMTPAAAALMAENDGVVIARKLLNSTVGASSVCAPVTAPECKRGAAPQAPITTIGPTLLSKSTNNGLSWSDPVRIVHPGLNNQTIDNLVQVLPNGNVYDFFTAIGFGPTGLDIGYVFSPTKGVNWSAPAFATDIQVVGVVSPDSGQPLRDASILFSVAVNPKNGAIYLAWQDDRFIKSAKCTTPTGTIPIDSIAFSQSVDGGGSWSKPIMINQTPANAAHPCREQAFIPAVVATGDGKAAVVTYYDFRNDTNTPVVFEGTDYFAVICKTAITDCSNPADWGDEQRLTTKSFNILDAPVARGHFLGDYMGLAASGPNAVYPLFGVATQPNITVEYTRKIFGLPGSQSAQVGAQE
jgi:hypothetical protein